MKRLSLLFAVTSIALCSQAQSVNVPSNHREFRFDGAVKPGHVIPKTMRTAVSTGKTTSGAAGDWFCFAVAGDDGTASSGQYIPIYPDSNVMIVPTTGSPFNWWIHGMGVSLDPTSTYYSSAWANTAVTAPDFTVTSSDAYTVDSVEIVVAYQRNKSYTDTLYIDVVDARSDSAWLVSWHSATLLSGGYSEDTFIRAASAYYDWANNQLNPVQVHNVKRITKILDAAAAADTMTGGYNDWVFAIPGGGLNVAAGGKVVSYAHFATGYHYSLGTNIDSGNYLMQFSMDLAHIPFQKTGDYSGGLIATTDDRYHVAGNFWSLSGWPILGPAYLIHSATSAFYDKLHDPFINFHLKCPTCGVVNAVNDAKAAVSEMNAFPNPANNNVTVAFQLVKNGNATVTITNVTGQVVATQTIENVTSGKATFNTSNLPDGTYVYTVNANGLKSSARVVIAH